jgi:hypothetical protein
MNSAGSKLLRGAQPKNPRFPRNTLELKDNLVSPKGKLNSIFRAFLIPREEFPRPSRALENSPPNH